MLAEFGLPTVTSVEVDGTTDNSDAAPGFTTTGSWTPTNSAAAQNGSYLIATASTGATATWQFDLEHYGQAELLVRWVAASNRVDRAQYSIDTGFDTQVLFANQKVDSGEWVPLGSFPVAAGTREVVLTAPDAAPGSILVADAVRLVVTAASPASADFTGDGTVNLADYTRWRDSRGSQVVRGTGADANGDAMVDAEDYAWWKRQFGTTVGSAAVISPVASDAAFAELSQDTPPPPTTPLGVLGTGTLGRRSLAGFEPRFGTKRRCHRRELLVRASGLPNCQTGAETGMATEGAPGLRRTAPRADSLPETEPAQRLSPNIDGVGPAL